MSGGSQPAGSEPPNAPKPDALVGYMERSNSLFEDQIRTPLRMIFGGIREIRNYVVTSSDLQENHADLVEKMDKIDDEVWKVFQSAKKISRRFEGQVQKAKKKAAQSRRPSATPSKSVKRQEAGKLKAVSLTSWRQDCASAREALKKEGYKGSLKVKKGMPMYEKVLAIQKGRIAGTSSPCGTGGSTAAVPAPMAALIM